MKKPCSKVVIESIKNVIYELMFIPAMFYCCHQIEYKDTSKHRDLDLESALDITLVGMKVKAAQVTPLHNDLKPLLSNLSKSRQSHLINTLITLIANLDLRSYESALNRDVTFLCCSFGVYMYSLLVRHGVKEKNEEEQRLLFANLREGIGKISKRGKQKGILDVVDYLQNPLTMERMDQLRNE